jgi:predicted NBD/HSP70 family sugar kinase
LHSWAEFPFLECLALRFGAPLWAQGTAQVMTMGELKSGAARGESDVIYCELGRSINAGVVSNGRLHVGARGAAGMIGHSLVDGNTLEAVAGSDAMAAEGQLVAREGLSPYLAATLARTGEISPADIGHGAQLGDPVSIELLSRAGRLVGAALAPLANLINPSMIVLAGPVAQTGDTLLAAVREAVYRTSDPLVTRDLKIVRSQMGSSAGLVGAAQLAVESVFTPRVLAGWVALGSPRQHPEFLSFKAQAAERRPPMRKRAQPPPGQAHDR